MQLRKISLCASLIALSVAFHANAQTPSVKQSPLAGVRAKLTHYDLAPQGTLNVLPELAKCARTCTGAEATEAAFLHAAVATDLYFLAGYTANEALRAGLASHFGVAPEALPQAIRAELAANANGVYREPALAAIGFLQPTAAGPSPTERSDMRRDAAFLRAAAPFAAAPDAGAHLAALGTDPCARQEACPQPYAALSDEGRRALGCLQQLSAAAKRLSRERGPGDPLSEVVGAQIDQDLAALRGLTLRLPPRLNDELKLQLPGGSGVWPAPDLLVLVGARELRTARLPHVRLGTDFKVEFLSQPSAVFPTVTVVKYSGTDKSPATRSMDEVVEAMRAARGTDDNLRVALIVENSDVSTQLVARTLVSMRKAGLPNLVLASHTKQGALVGVPMRVVVSGVDEPGSTPDLKLRVRLGGYSLDVGHGTVDIPRVRDTSGWQFDVATLQNAAKARAPKSAAVSFMPEVATEQVLWAMFHVMPASAAVDLVIQ